MKKFYILFPFLILTLVLLTNIASAQTAGPSVVATTPTGPVDKYVCYGGAISLSDPDVTAGNTYQWFKLDASGTPSQVMSMTGSTYTETATTEGYYNYEVVTINANGCSSPVSGVFHVFVLPQLSVTITPSVASFCANGAATPSVLTANPTPATGYTYTYQWAQVVGGVTSNVGTNSTYNVPAQTTAGTLTYNVTISYVLNNGCTATASQTITVYALPAQPTITAN